MPNPFVKLWKYLTASANAQIDQRAGAQAGHERHGCAEPAGGHRDVQRVAARPGDVLRRGPLRARAGLRDGQQVDDQLAQDAQGGDGCGHGPTVGGAVRADPLATFRTHLGRWW